jgi:shikimate kinase
MHNSSIILIGMPGSGKSTIGKMLAGELSYRFTDLDVYIREKEGRSLQEIIDRDGEDYLMQIEKQCMSEIDLTRRVIAPGGSLVYYEDLMLFLQQKATLVYLKESLSSLQTRLYNASSRGIIGLKNKPLAGLFAERQPLYQRYADITIDCDGLTRAQIVHEILDRLKSF